MVLLRLLGCYRHSFAEEVWLPLRSRHSMSCLVLFYFRYPCTLIGAPITSRSCRNHANAFLSSPVSPACKRPLQLLLCAAGFNAKSPRSSSSADPQQRQSAPQGSRIRGDWPCSAPPGGAPWTMIRPRYAQLCGDHDMLLPKLQCLHLRGRCLPTWLHSCLRAKQSSFSACRGELPHIVVCLLTYVSKNSTGSCLATNTCYGGMMRPVSHC